MLRPSTTRKRMARRHPHHFLAVAFSFPYVRYEVSVRFSQRLLMNHDGPKGQDPQFRRLLAYIVDLEVEVDRLRQHNRLVNEQVRAALEATRRANGDKRGIDQAEAIDAIIAL